MTDCPNGDVRDALPDYVNDRLDAARRVEVERHLETCAACRDEVALLRELRATMRRSPTVNVEAIAAAIPPYRAPVARGWTGSWRTAAAIAAIAVGGASLALLRDDPPADGDARTPPYAQAPAPTEDSIAVAPRAPRVPDVGPSTIPAPASASSRELALAGGSIGDLSDGELSALVEDLESLDAVPSAEVDGTQPLSLNAQEES